MNYCPNCGTRLDATIIYKSSVKKCSNCNYIDWDNWVNVSTVVVAYDDKEEFLMVRLKGKEEGKITFPGGYRNLGETLEEAAKREFFEETGMIISNIELFKTYTKDEQRLVWIVYKAKIDNINFIENDEVSSILFVKNKNDVNLDELRGKLTEQLFNDIFL